MFIREFSFKSKNGFSASSIIICPDFLTSYSGNKISFDKFLFKTSLQAQIFSSNQTELNNLVRRFMNENHDQWFHPIPKWSLHRCKQTKLFWCCWICHRNRKMDQMCCWKYIKTVYQSQHFMVWKSKQRCQHDNMSICTLTLCEVKRLFVFSFT